MSVNGSCTLITTWLRMRILNVSTPAAISTKEGMAVTKVEIRYSGVRGSSGRPRNPVITFTSAMDEVTEEPMPENTRATANRSAAKGPARGARVREAYSMLSTATPF